MRKILLLFAVMFCVGFSVNTQILGMGNMKSLFKADDGGHIIISSEYIDTFINESHNDIEPYILKGKSVINADDDYTIKCFKYNGWENEAGDFNVIEISTVQGEVLRLRSDEGWDNISVTALQCGNNKPYHYETLANGSIALFFTGTVLMSQPPYLTIIVLTHGKAYLVFNKKMIINNVVRNNGDLLFNLQENVVEWIDENTPAGDAVLHTISVKDGLMYFE